MADLATFPEIPKNRGWWSMIFFNMKFRTSPSWSQNPYLRGDLVAKNKFTPPALECARNGPKRLQMADVATLPEIPKIVGDDLWFFKKYEIFNIVKKSNPKPLRTRRFSRQKWTHAAGPRMRPKNDPKRLQMTDLVTLPGTPKNRGWWPMIF